MALASVPFKLPAPYPLPDGLRQTLRAQPVEQNVEAIMPMFIDEGMADLVLLEVAHGSDLRVKALYGRDPDAFRPLAGSVEALEERFSAKALESGSPLLLMGEVAAGEPGLRPAFVEGFLAGRPSADLGFGYVIPLVGPSGTRHGVLTLIRADGPLNHDQPAIVQAFSQWLAQRFDEQAS